MFVTIPYNNYKSQVGFSLFIYYLSNILTIGPLLGYSTHKEYVLKIFTNFEILVLDAHSFELLCVSFLLPYCFLCSTHKVILFSIFS